MKLHPDYPAEKSPEFSTIKKISKIISVNNELFFAKENKLS
jgi:hypothetical protein